MPKNVTIRPLNLIVRVQKVIVLLIFLKIGENNAEIDLIFSAFGVFFPAFASQNSDVGARRSIKSELRTPTLTFFAPVLEIF